MSTDWKPPVLVVDDDSGIRAMVREILQLEGYRVQTANDGREALAVLQRTRERYVILLGLVMPDMDGYQMLRRLEERPEERERHRVILISAQSHFAIERGLRVEGVCAKPFTCDQLLHEIETCSEGWYGWTGSDGPIKEWLKQSENAGHIKGRWRPPVLVVNDDRAIRQMLCALLEMFGYTVLQAGDGQEALGVLAQNPGRYIILLDTMMPRMDAFAMLARLGKISGERAKHKIILCSADRRLHEAEALCLDGYLSLPFSGDYLEDLVDEIGALGWPQ
jgi:CheY-like chemotaxis protein